MSQGEGALGLGLRFGLRIRLWLGRFIDMAVTGFTGLHTQIHERVGSDVMPILIQCAANPFREGVRACIGLGRQQLPSLT